MSTNVFYLTLMGTGHEVESELVEVHFSTLNSVINMNTSFFLIVEAQNLSLLRHFEPKSAL